MRIAPEGWPFIAAAWILALGYVLWAVEAVGTRGATKKLPCEAPVVEMSTPGSANAPVTGRNNS